MIETDLYNYLNHFDTTYAGSLPQDSDTGICYQVISREETQNQLGLSGLTATHFRIQIYDDYLQAKQTTTDIKLGLIDTNWKWEIENEYDSWLSHNDGTDNYFNCLALDLTIWSGDSDVYQIKRAYSTAYG